MGPLLLLFNLRRFLNAVWQRLGRAPGTLARTRSGLGPRRRRSWWVWRRQISSELVDGIRSALPVTYGQSFSLLGPVVPHVWLLGYLYIFWVAQRADCRPGGRNLGFHNVTVTWRGHHVLQWPLESAGWHAHWSSWTSKLEEIISASCGCPICLP